MVCRCLALPFPSSTSTSTPTPTNIHTTASQSIRMSINLHILRPNNHILNFVDRGSCFAFTLAARMLLFNSHRWSTILLLLLARALELLADSIVMTEFVSANTRHQLSMRLHEILFRDHNSRIFLCGEMVEEVGDGYWWCMSIVVLFNFFVDDFGAARNGFEHGVGAEGVHVCTCVCER